MFYKSILATALVFCVMVFTPFNFARAQVKINEIAWMGMLPKSGESTAAASNNEWLELYNTATNSVSLEGWKVISQDGTPDISLHGNIAAGGYFLLERGSQDLIPGFTADLFYTGAMSNSGEHLFLKNSNGSVEDEVDASLGWPAGDNITKQTMQNTTNGWITASSTPKTQNVNSVIIAQSSATAETNSSADPSNSSISRDQNNYTVPVAALLLPRIKAYAGDDQTMVAGGSLDLAGNALGLKDEPLNNARFWWNFGDGEVAEGRVLNHIFKIPGNYVVGLYVSSGEYAASDYLWVKVIPNQVTVKNVVGGKDGFVSLINPSDVNVDIGGWQIEDAKGNIFYLPVKTQIGAKSDVSFANDITKILDADPYYPLTLRYPNSQIIFKWTGDLLNSEKKQNDTVSFASVNTGEQNQPVVYESASIASYAQGSIDKKLSSDNTENVSSPNIDQTMTSESSSTAGNLANVSVSNYRRSRLFLVVAVIFSLLAAIGFIFLRKSGK